MLLTLRAYHYSVGDELSARGLRHMNRLWRPIQCRLRISQRSRPPAVNCRVEKGGHTQSGG